MKLTLALSGLTAVSAINNHHKKFMKNTKLTVDSSQHHKANSTAFVTDKVFVNDQLIFCHDPDILGVAGSEPQDTCQERDINNELNSVKVCGIAMQAVVYSQHGCMDNANEIATVGICDTSKKPETCIQVDAPQSGAPGSEENVWFKNALSYKIRVCPGMEVPPPPVLAAPSAAADDKAGAEEMMEAAHEQVEAEEAADAESKASAEAAADAGAADSSEGDKSADVEELTLKEASGGALDGNVVLDVKKEEGGADAAEDAAAKEAEAKAAAAEAEDVPAQSPAEEEAETTAAPTPEPVVDEEKEEPIDIPQPSGTGGAVTQFRFHIPTPPIVHHVVNIVQHVSNWFGGWR